MNFYKQLCINPSSDTRACPSKHQTISYQKLSCISLCDKAYTTTLMTQTKHSTTTEVLKSKETRRVGERKTNKSLKIRKRQR